MYGFLAYLLADLCMYYLVCTEARRACTPGRSQWERWESMIDSGGPHVALELGATVSFFTTLTAVLRSAGDPAKAATVR